MNWFEAWLLINLGWFQGFFLAIGFLFLGLNVWRISAYWIDMCGYYELSQTQVEKVNKNQRTKMTKSFFRLFPFACFFWFLASLVPSTADIFKIVAVKYGYEAATSDRAKQLADNGLKAMENTLNLLNKKLGQIK